ncbi:hypothetical protein PMAYCL1PPCAC_25607, partial [Pristionchus mayeri]
ERRHRKSSTRVDSNGLLVLSIMTMVTQISRCNVESITMDPGSVTGMWNCVLLKLMARPGFARIYSTSIKKAPF